MLFYGVLFVACTAPEKAIEVEHDPCNRISDTRCMLPFPSDHWRDDERLNFSTEVLPVNVDGIGFEADRLNRLDGFSLGTGFYFQLPGATLTGAPRWPDIERSMEIDSPTILINVETGERIPHHLDWEDNALLNEQEPVMIIRPMIPLPYGTTVVAAIKGLVDDTGEAIEAPTGFVAIRDGSGKESPAASQVDTYVNTVFPALADAGVDKEELQLAWSATTASETKTLGLMRSIKEDALDYVQSGPIGLTVEEIENEDCSSEQRKGRIIKGVFDAPLYLPTWNPGETFSEEALENPKRTGLASVGFLAIISCSVIESGIPGKAVQYGHGIGGTRREMESSYLKDMADDYGWVLFAIDWTGLKFDDMGSIAMTLIQNPSDVTTVMDRSAQGFAEQLTMSYAIRQDSTLAMPAFQKDGQPLIDQGPVSYYGNSMGAVLGGGYIAFNSEIDRAVLGVSGAPFSLLLTRAEGFTTFLDILQVMYEDWADISLLMGLLQQVWDPVETIGWIHDEGHQDTPSLIQLGIGDRGVPTIGGHVLARGLKAKLLSPYSRPVYGLESATGPLNSSALVELDFGEVDPDAALPATNAHTHSHEAVRTNEKAKEQVGIFINTGQIVHTCDGPCDPN